MKNEGTNEWRAKLDGTSSGMLVAVILVVVVVVILVIVVVFVVVAAVAAVDSVFILVGIRTSEQK